MVAIQSLIATIAFALAVNAAPSEVVARQGGGPQPGSNAAGLRFFTASDTDCDQNGGSFTQASVFVPQAGTSHPFLTGQCIQQATYGSVNVDFLLPTCQFEQHISSLCADTGTITTNSGCQLGGIGFTAWRVTCASP